MEQDQYWEEISFGYRKDYRLYKDKKIVISISNIQAISTLTIYTFDDKYEDETNFSERECYLVLKEKRTVFEEVVINKDLLYIQLKGLIEAKRCGWDLKMIFEIFKNKDIISNEEWERIEV